MDVYDRLEDLSADTAEARAANILHGLGFTRDMQQKATKDFSGGLYLLTVTSSPGTQVLGKSLIIGIRHAIRI